MQRTVELDPEMESELSHAVQLTKADPASLLQQAVREGLPVLTIKLSEPRPAGYFAADYGHDPERDQLEASMSGVLQSPER
jgi:hypothetical protein